MSADDTKRITVPLSIDVFKPDGKVKDVDDFTVSLILPGEEYIVEDAGDDDPDMFSTNVHSLVNALDDEGCRLLIAALWSRLAAIKEEERNDPMRKMLREQEALERKIAALLAARAVETAVEA